MQINKYEIVSNAKNFGISPQKAIKCRLNYLANEIKEWIDMVNDGRATQDFASICLKPLYDESLELNTLLKDTSLSYKTLPSNNSYISETDIQIAKDYPIDKIVKFVRGRAHAPCHNDKNPSLYHGTRLNIAVCPVCDRKFNPIQWLMFTEEMSFKEAVSYLLRG